jgi:hypothetical protein
MALGHLTEQKKASEDRASEMIIVNPYSLNDEILRFNNLEPQDESALGL